jgi:hypothetical protein
MILATVGILSGSCAWWEIRSSQQRTTEKARILASSLANAARLPLFADDREALARLAAETAAYSGVASVTISTTAGDVVARAGLSGAPGRGAVISGEAVVQTVPSGAAPEIDLGLAPENAPLGRVRVTMGDTELREFLRFLLTMAGLVALLGWAVGYLVYRKCLPRGNRNLAH